jgi:hypothetical protein
MYDVNPSLNQVAFSAAPHSELLHQCFRRTSYSPENAGNVLANLLAQMHVTSVEIDEHFVPDDLVSPPVLFNSTP